MQSRFHRLVWEREPIHHLQMCVPQRIRYLVSPKVIRPAGCCMRERTTSFERVQTLVRQMLGCASALKEEQIRGRVRSCPPCSLLCLPARVAAVQHTQLLDLHCNLLREWSVRLCYHSSLHNSVPGRTVDWESYCRRCCWTASVLRRARAYPSLVSFMCLPSLPGY